MAETITPKLPYKLADYIDVAGVGGGSFELMSVYTSINESPNAETEETQYTVNKSKSVDTVSYSTQFAFEGVLHENEKTTEYLEAIGKECKLGKDAETDLCVVELDKPIELEANTYYARKFKVGIEITDLPNEAGTKRKISGNLNSLSDPVIGKFNTETKTFTPDGEE